VFSNSRRESRNFTTQLPALPKPQFCFQWSLGAAATNWRILQQNRLDLDKAQRHPRGNPCTPGSEFRQQRLLAPLISDHRLWDNLCQWMQHGVSHPLLPISEADRVTDLQAMISRGNHRSATDNYEALDAIFRHEVKRGWTLPLPPEAALLLPDAIIAPLCFKLQDTRNEKGEIVRKERLTHE
jgi:hypothetical protein